MLQQGQAKKYAGMHLHRGLNNDKNLQPLQKLQCSTFTKSNVKLH